MPQAGLEAVVQRMIDAGESEENIAAVIRSKPAAAAPPTVDRYPRRADGMPAVTSDTSDSETPSPLLAMLGPYAHPETLTDFARILTLPVDSVRRAFAATLSMAAARSGAATTAQAVKAVPGAAVRGAVKGVAAVGDVVDPDVIGVVSPRVGKAVELAQKMRTKLPAGVAPVAAEDATSLPGYPRGGTARPPDFYRAMEEPASAAPKAARAAAPVDEFTAARTAKAGKLPDQKALNEAALAARRSAYQAQQQGAPPTPPPAGPVVAASGKMQLTAPEMKEFTRLIAKKMPLEDALTAVKQMRSLAAKLGGATDAQVSAAVAHREVSGKW